MLQEAIRIAKEAGSYIKDNYGSSHSISYKDAHNIVSEVDRPSEAIILKELEVLFPDHSIFSEESGLHDKGSEYLWIVDPLDGTTNFTRRLGRFSVSIALSYQKKPLLGVVYAPLADELFYAQAGKGAFFKDKSTHIPDSPALNETLLLLGRGSSAEQKKRSNNVYALLTPQVRTLRMLGCFSLDTCSLLTQQLDAVVFNGCNFYDAAAAALVAMEAGASCTDFKGNPWDINAPHSDIIIAHPLLAKQLLALTSQASL